VTPSVGWSADELTRAPLLEQDVAVNLCRHGNLIAWAKERGLLARVDRATPWGNPFELGKDGDRETVVARYRDDHLHARPDLLARLGELRGKALLAKLHADVSSIDLERTLRVGARSRDRKPTEEDVQLTPRRWHRRPHRQGRRPLSHVSVRDCPSSALRVQADSRQV
jgi:Domain of unknown function (DUF4326)